MNKTFDKYFTSSADAAANFIKFFHWFELELCIYMFACCIVSFCFVVVVVVVILLFVYLFLWLPCFYFFCVIYLCVYVFVLTYPPMGWYFVLKFYYNFNIETVVVLADIPIKNTPQHRLKRFFIIRTTGYVWLKKINILQYHKYMRHFTANTPTTTLTLTQRITIFNNTSPVLTQFLTIKTIAMKTKRLFTINWKFRTMITLTINPITLKMMTNKLKIKTTV